MTQVRMPCSAYVKLHSTDSDDQMQRAEAVKNSRKFSSWRMTCGVFGTRTRVNAR